MQRLTHDFNGHCGLAIPAELAVPDFRIQDEDAPGLAQLDQLQAIFGIFAVISAVKSRVSIAAP